MSSLFRQIITTAVTLVTTACKVIVKGFSSLLIDDIRMDNLFSGSELQQLLLSFAIWNLVPHHVGKAAGKETVNQLSVPLFSHDSDLSE